MKLKLLTAIIPLLATGALADSITFTEKLNDRYVCYSEEGERFCDVERSLKLTLNASIRVPGLGAVVFAPEDSLTLALGSQSITFTFAEAEAGATPNRAVFLDQECFDEGPCEVFGRLTVSRSGDVLILAGSFGLDPDSSIVAANHTEEAGPFSGDSEGITFSFEAGSVGPITRQLYYKGTTTITRKRIGSGEEADFIFLANVQVSGAADYTPPAAAVVFPKANATYRSCSNNVVVLIKATDNASLSEVFVALNAGEFVAADAGFTEEFEPTDFWVAALELEPGLNTIWTYALDREGNVSATNTHRLTYVIAKPLTLKTGPGGTVVGATDGQLLDLGRSYRLTARPAANHFFERWVMESAVSGTSTSSNAVLNFTMETNLTICAVFVTNKFSPIAGSFNGLFAPVDEDNDPVVAVTNAGALSLALTTQGRFSGRITLNGVTHRFAGTSGLDGHARVLIAPRNQSPITLELEFLLVTDRAFAGVSGTVSRDGWVAAIYAVAAAARGSVRSLEGNYTFLIPGAGAEMAGVEPAGDGAATAKLNASGHLTMAGALGDGAVFSGAAPVSSSGEMPVFRTLYGNKGLLWGWVAVKTNVPQLDFGCLSWIKPAGVARDPLYTNGFAVKRLLWGARYVAPPRGASALDWPTTNGVVLLDGGNLTSTLSNAVALANNRITVLGDNSDQVRLAINPRSGVISGSFRHPATGRAAGVKGVVLQLPSSEGIAAGWFRGPTESGYLRLEYTPPSP